MEPKEALPRHKATVTQPNRCLEVVGAESEGFLDSFADVQDGVLSQATERVLATRGMKSAPEE